MTEAEKAFRECFNIVEGPLEHLPSPWADMWDAYRTAWKARGERDREVVADITGDELHRAVVQSAIAKLDE